jgi:hypothetical protein
LPENVVHAVYTVTLGLQSAQFESPGATRSTLLSPFCEKPEDEIVAMLLSSQFPLRDFGAGALIPPKVSCL